VKDFDKWNRLKKKLNKRKIKFFYKEREVRWCSVGINIDKEIDGKRESFSRPVLIIKKINRHTCLIVPFTGTNKEGKNLRRLILNKNIQKINLGQIKVISSNRLDRLFAIVDRITFDLIKVDIKDFYF